MKPVCLGLSILYLSKTVIHEFWFDYEKPKYGGNAERRHMDTDSFIVYIRFKSERHNVFTEEINKIAVSSNNVKRIQSVDSPKAYAYGTSKDLVSEKE